MSAIHHAPSTAVLVALIPLPAVILVGLYWVRHRAPEPTPRPSLGGFFVAYAAAYGLTLVAARLGGVPATLSALAGLVGLLGLGVGVARLYALLYGTAWVSEHMHLIEVDVALWRPLALRLAALLLVAAIALGVLAPPGVE
jgi:hypothetical protein